MAFVLLFPEGVRSGQGTSPAVTVPGGSSRVIIRLTSTNWPTSNTWMDFTLERSDDNGANWRAVTSGRVFEGARNADGSIYQVSLNVADADPVNGCQIRARYNFTQGSMRFGGEWDVLDANGNSINEPV